MTFYNDFSKLNISVGSIISINRIKSFNKYKKIKINVALKNLYVVKKV